MLFSQLSAQEIREQNKQIDAQGRELCAEIGALWYEIDRRKLWREWGYSSLPECIENEGPRAYSTVMECVVNYLFFVVQGAFTFEQFKTLVLEHGIRKVSMIRRQYNISDTSSEVSGEHQQEHIRVVAQQLQPLSVREAGAIVSQRERQLGIPDAQFVSRRYALQPEQDRILQEAIAHIKSRVMGMSTMSDSTAVYYLAAEYLAANGMRKVAA